MGNAVKFTYCGEVYLGVTALGRSEFLFEVIDTGLGIPEEERPGIFEPFHQGKGAQHHGGTGLGLAIARRQVQLMGGTLEFQSERGTGTRFYFTILLEQCRVTDSVVDASLEVNGERPNGLALVALPEDLCERLLVAAELHSATALKSCLNELNSLGPDASRLGDVIRSMMRSYNMEEIQRVLAETVIVRKLETHHENGFFRGY